MSGPTNRRNLHGDEPYQSTIYIRCSPELKSAYMQQAKKDGVKSSDLGRRLLAKALGVPAEKQQ